MGKYLVTGPQRVGGARRGETVTLDEQVVRVDLLLAAGAIARAPAKKATAARARADESADGDQAAGEVSA